MYTKRDLHKFIRDLDDVQLEYAWSRSSFEEKEERRETKKHLKSLEEVTAIICDLNRGEMVEVEEAAK